MSTSKETTSPSGWAVPTSPSGWAIPEGMVLGKVKGGRGPVFRTLIVDEAGVVVDDRLDALTAEQRAGKQSMPVVRHGASVSRPVAGHPYSGPDRRCGGVRKTRPVNCPLRGA